MTVKRMVRLATSLGLLIIVTVVARSALATVILETPTIYGLPGQSVTVAVFLRSDGEEVGGLQYMLNVGLAARNCDRGSDIGGGVLRLITTRGPFLNNQQLQICTVTLPSEPGRLQMSFSGVIISDPRGTRLPFETSAGEIVVTLDVPTPTPTPTGPGVCGNFIIESDEQCDDGNSFAGDGCAANCTVESRRPFVIHSGACAGGTRAGQPCRGDRDCPASVCSVDRSVATLQGRSLQLVLPLQGSLALRTGQARQVTSTSLDGRTVIGAGQIPFAIRTEDTVIDPIPLPGFACVCLRLVADDGPFGPTGFFEGNAGVGEIACGEAEGPADDFELIADHDISDIDPECTTGVIDSRGACNSIPESPTFSGSGEPGSAILQLSLSVTTIFDGGTCCRVGVDPGCRDTGAKGADGIPCTSDEAYSRSSIVYATTGVAAAAVLSADQTAARIAVGSLTPCNDQTACEAEDEECFTDALDPSAAHCRVGCNTLACLAHVEGEPFDCDSFAPANTPLEGGALALASVQLNGPFGDSVITSILRPAPSLAPTRPPTETPTSAPTSTPSASPTISPTSSPIPTPCAGDCDGDRNITVDELMRGVLIALGLAPVNDCTAFDLNGDGKIAVDELLVAVTAALTTCNRQA